MSTEYHHQIVLRQNSKNATVSCYCRAVLGRHVREPGGVDYCEPMVWPAHLTAFTVYNQPENHWAPFTEENRIKT